MLIKIEHVLCRQRETINIHGGQNKGECIQCIHIPHFFFLQSSSTLLFVCNHNTHSGPMSNSTAVIARLESKHLTVSPSHSEGRLFNKRLSSPIVYPLEIYVFLGVTSFSKVNISLFILIIPPNFLYLHVLPPSDIKDIFRYNNIHSHGLSEEYSGLYPLHTPSSLTRSISKFNWHSTYNFVVMSSGFHPQLYVP